MKSVNTRNVPHKEATMTVREVTALDEPTGSEILFWEAFEARGHRYVLKEPTACYGAREDGYHVFECPQYGISGCAKSREEALADLNAEFAFLYDGLVGQSDALLSLDARELRDLLQRAILRVETEQMGVTV